jgi:hypothetical protein
MIQRTMTHLQLKILLPTQGMILLHLTPITRTRHMEDQFDIQQATKVTPL